MSTHPSARSVRLDEGHLADDLRALRVAELLQLHRAIEDALVARGIVLEDEYPCRRPTQHETGLRRPPLDAVPAGDSPATKG